MYINIKFGDYIWSINLLFILYIQKTADIVVVIVIQWNIAKLPEIIKSLYLKMNMFTSTENVHSLVYIKQLSAHIQILLNFSLCIKQRYLIINHLFITCI